MSAGLNCANCGGLLTLTRADADGYRRWAHVENDSAQCPTQHEIVLVLNRRMT